MTPIERFRRSAPAYIGPVLAVIGLVAIVSAIRQTLATGDPRLQMQQVVSGGIGGLALLIAGVSVWVLHSLARTRTMIQEMKEARDHTRTADDSDVVSPVATVVATKESFHAEGCVLLSGKRATRTFAIEDALRSGLTPCGLCLRQVDIR